MFRFLHASALKHSIREDRRRLGLALLATVFRGLLALGAPWFLGAALDVISNREPQSALWRMLGLMFTFAIATALAQFWMRWLWIGWSRTAEQKSRDGLFHHVLHLPASFFDRSKVGELMSRFTSDVEAVRMGYGPGIMHCAQTGLMLIGALGLMLSMSLRLTALAILPLIALYFALRALLARMHDLSTKVQEAQAALSAKAQETFSGARVIKAFAREEAEAERFGEQSTAVLDAGLKLAETRGLFSCAIELANALVMVVVLFIGGREVLLGALSLGDYAAFVAYLNMLIWPMIALSWTFSLFQRAEAASDRLNALLGESREDRGKGLLVPKDGGEIRFVDLSFHYPGHPLVLKDWNEVIPPRSKLGIVGPTASGKTTLVQLLLRLHEARTGSILLAGRPIDDYDLKSLRESIAWVPQETFLFSDTLRANLCFAADNPSDSEIESAIHTAGLDQDLAQLPDGLDTLIGERGIGLSGGQKQRVAIARALLCKAPILLLDDALSAVDVETEQRILSRLQEEVAGRTLIIVSHRLSSVQQADRILVLEQGRIAESGTHEDLLKRGGAYARTYSLQQDERALELGR